MTEPDGEFETAVRVAALESRHELLAEIERLKDELAITRGIARLVNPEELREHDQQTPEGTTW